MNITDNRFELWPKEPRNFATEPATWYDALISMKSIGLDDFRLVVEFELVSSTASRVFQNQAVGSFYLGVWQPAEGVIQSTTIIASPSSFNGILSSDSVEGYHRFSVQRLNGVVDIIFDGVTKYHATGQTSIDTSIMRQPFTSAHDGSLKLVEITNLSTNEVIWAYPSESERLRLITNTNVLNTGTHWEAADTSLSWTIQTQAVGATGTVLAKINGIVVTNPAQFDKATGLFTGAPTDTLDWLMPFSETLTAEQIAYLSKQEN